MNAAQIKQEDRRRQSEKEAEYEAMMNDKDVVHQEEICENCNPYDCKHYDFDSLIDHDEKGRFVEITHACKKYNKECPTKEEGCLKGTEPVINSAHYYECSHGCGNYFTERSVCEYSPGKGRLYEVKHMCGKLKDRSPKHYDGCPLKKQLDE